MCCCLTAIDGYIGSFSATYPSNDSLPSANSAADECMSQSVVIFSGVVGDALVFATLRIIDTDIQISSFPTLLSPYIDSVLPAVSIDERRSDHC
jgi:hypothetical protein